MTILAGCLRAMPVTVIALLVASCGSGPEVKLYVLGHTPPPAIGVVSEAGRPIVELRRISVPDYLDSTDLLEKTGPNQFTASLTGRWGERLSVGVTRAVAASLSAQLPRMVVTTADTDAARRLFVDVDKFDVEIDRSCLLSARWWIAGEDGHTSLASEHGVFRAIAPALDDQSMTATMSGLIDQLTASVAVTVQQASGIASP